MIFPTLLASLELYEKQDPEIPDLGVEFTRLNVYHDTSPLRVAEMVLDRLVSYLASETAGLATTEAAMAVARAWKDVEVLRDRELGGDAA